MSDVTRIIQQIDLERESLQNALFGLAAGVTRHDFIEARAARGAGHILQLVQEGKHEEAIELMNKPDWGEAVQDAGTGILQ
jgi:hypothetical protein